MLQEWMFYAYHKREKKGKKKKKKELAIKVSILRITIVCK